MSILSKEPESLYEFYYLGEVRQTKGYFFLLYLEFKIGAYYF